MKRFKPFKFVSTNNVCCYLTLLATRSTCIWFKLLSNMAFLTEVMGKHQGLWQISNASLLLLMLIITPNSRHCIKSCILPFTGGNVGFDGMVAMEYILQNEITYSYAGDIVGMHKGCIIQLMNQKRCEVSGSFHDYIRKHLNATIWVCSHAEHVHFTLLFLSVSLNLSLCL